MRGGVRGHFGDSTMQRTDMLLTGLNILSAGFRFAGLVMLHSRIDWMRLGIFSSPRSRKARMLLQQAGIGASRLIQQHLLSGSWAVSVPPSRLSRPLDASA